MDAGSLPDALHVPNEPETRTRHDDKLTLKIGNANANDIDTDLLYFHRKKIKGQRNKGKLIEDFAEAMGKDGIKISTQTVTKWLASCYGKANAEFFSASDSAGLSLSTWPPCAGPQPAAAGGSRRDARAARSLLVSQRWVRHTCAALRGPLPPVAGLRAVPSLLRQKRAGCGTHLSRPARTPRRLLRGVAPCPSDPQVTRGQSDRTLEHKTLSSLSKTPS
jgi:hypothetical protein